MVNYTETLRLIPCIRMLCGKILGNTKLALEDDIEEMIKKQIIALGGGGFSMEETPVLDNYILDVSRNENPRVCFVPTAIGNLCADCISRKRSHYRILGCVYVCPVLQLSKID